jgi:tetratricopeptide (TPR) repeat protein
LTVAPRVFHQWLVLAVLAFISFSIYSNTIDSPFVFDDTKTILNDPGIRLTKLTFGNIIKSGFEDSKTRPIALISFALNYYYHQYDPAGYHIVNIIIHILTGYFLYLFIATTLMIPSLRSQHDHPALIAFLASLIWLVHPVQTQSVTYIVQRMNSMASMLFILSFWFYVKGRLVEVGRTKWLWFTGSALFWLVSLGCKQITLMLPFLIILYEWYFLQNLSKDWFKRSLKLALGIGVLCVLVALIYTDFNPSEKFSHLNDFSNNEFTITQRTLTQPRVVIYYLSLLIYPHPSRLNLDYDFPLSYSLTNPITTLPALIIIIGLLILGLYLAKNNRLISFCIFWFFGNLVIESSVIPLAIIYEHRLYLPSMLVSLMTVILVYRYIKFKWLSVGIICAFAILCSFWTFERNNVWQNRLTLWTDCVIKSPNKARPHSNLGRVLAERGRTDEGIVHLVEALRIKPDYAVAHNNLGTVMEKQRRFREAIHHYSEAVRIFPQFANAHYNLGVIFHRQGRLNKAMQHYSETLKVEKNHAKAHNNIGAVFQSQGKLREAIWHFSEALRIEPDYLEAHNNLKHALTLKGKSAKEVSTAERPQS